LKTHAARILGCVLIVLLALAFAVVTVGASWIEDTAYRKNNWELTDHTHWKTAVQSFWQAYEIRWNYSDVVNFTQWSFYMNTWGYGEGHSWFDQDMETNVFFRVEGNTSTIVEVVVWYRYEQIFGVHKEDANIKLFVNGTIVEEVVGSDTPKPPDVQERFVQQGSILTVQVRAYDKEKKARGGFDYDVSVGSEWFKQVDLVQTVHAWGWGWIEGTKYSETIRQNVPGELTTEEVTPQSKSLIQDLITFISGVWTSIKEIMPAPIQALMGIIETLSDVAWTVIWLTFTIVSGLLPLLGVVIGFYFLNAGLKSLHEGSVEPLMKAAETFYNMFMGFANTAINMAKTIWSFVKFW